MTQTSVDYPKFLQVHFAALVSLRAGWRPQDAEDFAQMLQALRADLQTLGCAATAPTALSGTPPIPFEGLGIGYVVRGSRLGAAVLRRGVAGDMPTAYLDFVPTLSWTSFLSELESIANDAHGRDQATRAAQRSFRTFADEFVRLHGATSSSPPGLKTARF